MAMDPAAGGMPETAFADGSYDDGSVSRAIGAVLVSDDDHTLGQYWKGSK